MKLRQRYQRLSIWNKFGLWGGIASIVAIPLSLGLFWASLPASTEGGIALPVHQPRFPASSVADTVTRGVRVQLVALYVDSISKRAKSPQDSISWSAASALQIAEKWHGRATYCVEAPPGLRIAAVQVHIDEVVGAPPDVPAMFRITESTSTRVCYELRANQLRIPTCPPPVRCKLKDPVVKWRIYARFEQPSAA